MDCSKLFSGEIPELTNNILRNLRHDNSSLYSCALVNRFWSRLTIPILWENPFSAKNTKKTNLHNLDIYLSCLNDDDKESLRKLGVGRIDKLSLVPLFNYPSFIKVLDTYKLENSIKTWINLNLMEEERSSPESKTDLLTTPLRIIPYNENNDDIMSTTSTILTAQYSQLARYHCLSILPNCLTSLRRRAIFIQIFLSKSTKFIYITLLKLLIQNNVTLNTFVMNLNYSSEQRHWNEVYELMLDNSNFFSKSKHLTINFSCTQSFYLIQQNGLSKLQPFFSSLPFHCTSIKTLNLQHISNDVSKDITSLVRSQSQLSTISFKSVNIDLLHSFKFLKDCSSLTSVIFNECNFRNGCKFEGFEFLTNLESLQFINCKSLTQNTIQPLVNISTLKIRILTIMFTNKIYMMLESDNPMANVLLERFGMGIECLTLSLNGNRSEELLVSALNHCERIRFLHLISISYKHVPHIFKIIKRHDNSLKYLTLEIREHYRILDTSTNDQNQTLDTSSNLLRNLGQHLPVKLRYLNLYLPVNDSNDLKTFFYECKAVELKTFLIRTRSNRNFDLMFDVITDFVKGSKSLEYLAYGSRYNVYNATYNYYKILGKKIKEAGSSVKLARYDDLVVKASDI
ncbi:2613_t:CDS:1 [Funneliformis mosseae]|uniref:2613_t:CDS:1 n=1 Tax=Funneliformis mosseae TaxID=27381 RepID=A0A9N9EUT4_FUNMO|nr:2613_t:CDS:1 [Funneliformis mosseae]